uniref:UDENN domain-containing protein n=1 Tax=Kalanchoe fedtschenkoi TaxID=63787 RepID=A0A7N0UW27_KALFE
MPDNEDSGSPGWKASLFLQTTEDVARAVVAAAAAANGTRSPRPSIVFSTKDDGNNSPIQRFQRQVTRALKGFSNPSEVRPINYNPEVLTSQKRQWASCQMQSLDHRPPKEPSKLFESMVVVGLHPNSDILALQRQFLARKSEGSGKYRSPVNGQHQFRVEPTTEPQVLFAYPPDKQLPLKCKDLLSFCFPGGVEVHAVEKTPSMSELNEILLGQEHLKHSDQSFVFRLQVADDSTLYGCCVLVEEIIGKPSGLVSMVSHKQPTRFARSRHVLTTRRCYCILSRLPFFELHFGILNSIFMEERLQRLTKGISNLDFESQEEYTEEANEWLNEIKQASEIQEKNKTNLLLEHQNSEEKLISNNDNLVALVNESMASDLEKGSQICDTDDGKFITETQEEELGLPNPVLSFLRSHPYEMSESSSSFGSSFSEDRHFRSEENDSERDQASFSDREETTSHSEILEWAKENSNGSLQLLCEYYQLPCPSRGSTLTFHPLEHLHPIEYHRPDETVLHLSGSTIDLRSCNTSFELSEAHNALMAEEEAHALSVWAVASICGTLRLENVLAVFAATLLEKQLVMVCSNLGILSAVVLSIIPLIRPYQWQSLLMPVLPNDMLDFLDAPVPYVVGVQSRTTEIQSKLTNVILVDANKNQVKSHSVPQLPQYRQLLSSLGPYHAKLVGESFLGRKRPLYDCTDVQIEAAKGFLAVLRSYLDSLCSNLRSHTITNVQSNDDKVSLLLKESFIDSFSSRDKPFMKLFVDTQLFSVHTDLVLSFIQKE